MTTRLNINVSVMKTLVPECTACLSFELEAVGGAILDEAVVVRQSFVVATLDSHVNIISNDHWHRALFRSKTSKQLDLCSVESHWATSL